MDEIEKGLQQAASQLLTSLRQGRGIDDIAAERLKNALHQAAEVWANSEMISKSAANLFVDLASGIEACSYSYGSDGDRIKALADEVADLIRACVAVP
jgi:hypothetical protein